MASSRSQADIEMTGPFFQVDPGETMLNNITKMMQGVAEEGAKAARDGLLTGASTRQLISMTNDRVADHVVGRTASKSGKRWRAAAVVQVTNDGYGAAESRSIMAAGSYVERKTGAIRRVSRGIRSARAVLTADLTAGLE